MDHNTFVMKVLSLTLKGSNKTIFRFLEIRQYCAEPGNFIVDNGVGGIILGNKDLHVHKTHKFFYTELVYLNPKIDSQEVK